MATTLNDIPATYSEAIKYLGSKDDRPAGNNTRVQRIDYPNGDEAIAIVLHRTVIVWLFPEGLATLNTDGWETVTTKERINRVIREHGWNLYQEDYVWYLWDRYNDTHYRYHDGMVINLNNDEWRANSNNRIDN